MAAHSGPRVDAREFGRTESKQAGSALFRRYRCMIDVPSSTAGAENYDKVMMTLEAEGR
ncbi:MAG: hypothetical protein H6983_26450 [Ectothiorhodospiraceae bacterium]|nr:hypothetical protein [Ectothiorhodospiraceae bacterium]